MGSYTFLFFLVILLACITFIFFFVPETKNRTFDEIAHALLMGPSGMKTSRSSTAFLLQKSRSHIPMTPIDENVENHMIQNGSDPIILPRRRKNTEGNDDEDTLVHQKPVFEV